MSYTFAKALGGSVGNSSVEDDYLDTAKQILEDAKQRGKILLPKTRGRRQLYNNANKQTCKTDSIRWMVRVGYWSETEQEYANIIINQRPFFGMAQWAFLR